MNRRSFLKRAGIATLVIAGGSTWVAVHDGVFSSGKGPAFEPWSDWNDAGGGPLALVRAAILAASPHNTQPWLFRVTPSRIELYADRSRNTGALDPFLRELYLGLGCALENLMLAATAHGYNASLTMAGGNLATRIEVPRHALIATVDLTSRPAEASELFAAIPKRHTNRHRYDPQRPIAQHLLDELDRLATDADVRLLLFAKDPTRRKLAMLIANAEQKLYADRQVDLGSRRWIRIKWSSVQEFRDGLVIDNAGLDPVTTAVVKVLPLSVLDALAARADVNSAYRGLLLATPVLGIVAVRDRYDQLQTLRAGRLWQRTHLCATARGLSAQPVNEIVELIDHQRAGGAKPTAAHSITPLVGDDQWQPTFMFRMGYASRTTVPSPRRPLAAVVL